MTADTITAIKKALEGVTPGPWGYVASNENYGPYVCNDWGAGDICDGYVMSKPDSLSIRNGGDSRPINHQHDEADANMRYIAAVNPEAISDLLSTLESLQAKNEGFLKRAATAEKRLREANSAFERERKLHLKNQQLNRSIKAQAEAAEAEVKRYREALHIISAGHACPIALANNALRPAALSSTGDTHGN